MQFKQKVHAGEFAILAEIDTPKGVDVTDMVANATKVKGLVDAFVVPEMNSAVMKMSSLGGSMILQSLGMETVMQACCRDRNRLAIQADLLAAHACGITNIMAVKGEDPSFGDHHQARAVFDINISELLQIISDLQDGQDMAGVNLKGTPEYFVGSNINVATTGNILEQEIDEMKAKIDSGTRFFITQPLFDLSSIEPFLKQVDLSEVTIIPTVLLLKSSGMARYIDRNMPNINLPKNIIDRIQNAPDKVRECISISSEMIETLKQEGFGGVHISTVGWENRLPEILGIVRD